jgi:hypothetical protein
VKLDRLHKLDGAGSPSADGKRGVARGTGAAKETEADARKGIIRKWAQKYFDELVAWRASTVRQASNRIKTLNDDSSATCRCAISTLI